MKWKRILKDYDKLDEEGKNLFKQELFEKLNSEEISQEENCEVDNFVEEDPSWFDFQKELEECDCNCDCDCESNVENEYEYLQKLDMRLTVASNLLHNILNPDGTPYFKVDWVVENILKLKPNKK